MLGDGKDLISADGIVMYQIRDPYLYLERQRDAEEILEMLVYRALMMETSSRRLEDSLSENIQNYPKVSMSVFCFHHENINWESWLSMLHWLHYTCL